MTIARDIVGCEQDAEECVSDVYLKVWNSIPPERPHSLKAYIAVLTRRIAINRYHSNLRHSEMTVALSELEDFLSDDGSVDSQFDARELGRVISDFVRSLSERRRFIFVSRYYVADPIDTIAADLHLSRSMVNKELAAIRKALKERLESEGYLV